MAESSTRSSPDRGAGTVTSAVSRPSRVVPRPLAELAQSIGGRLTGESVSVTGISSNSTLAEPGDLFAALPGASGHGARFVSEARASGAVAVLTDRAGEAAITGLPLIVVDDPRGILGRISADIYGHPSRALPVFGVTGTSGKTTTTFLVRAGLSAAGMSSGLIGTVGVFVGDEVLKTPFTTPEAPQLQALLALMVERGMRFVGMEVSSHALRMGRVDGVDFEVGAFTNLSQDHLDFHRDMEDYFAAKSLLFDGRAKHEIVVTDDEWGRRLVQSRSTASTGRTITVATGKQASWTASSIEFDRYGGSSFTVTGPAGTFPAGCRIPGAYNVANALLALAILAELGLDPRASASAVAQAQVPGRMERVDGDQPFLAVVDYSHKPAGVTGALQALRPLTAEKLIIVLGCGGDRDRGKRPVMGEVAARQADVLIVTDDNPRSEDPAAIRAAMLQGARAVPEAESAVILEVGDRRSAIEAAIGRARPGDTVLVAGKGHETGQLIGDDMLPFDDVTVVREALLSQGFSVAAAVIETDGPNEHAGSGPASSVAPGVVDR